MKNRQLEFLFANVGLIINLLNSVSVNKESVSIHAANNQLVIKKLDILKNKYENQEYMNTLSPEERKVLLQNAQALYETHQKIQQELNYLDMGKHPEFVTRALGSLEEAYLLAEWLIEEVGASGDTIIPHLACVRPKTFGGGEYRNQIESLYIELEAISHDFYKDHVSNPDNATTEGYRYEGYAMLAPICRSLVLATEFLKKENERLKTESLPEHKKIEIPKEIKPEAPAAPEVSPLKVVRDEAEEVRSEQSA